MDEFEKIRECLDQQLTKSPPEVGIMFGSKLYEEFWHRGWFTHEKFSVLGTSLFEEKLPAYQKSHFAIKSWDIDPLEFKVGSVRA